MIILCLVRGSLSLISPARMSSQPPRARDGHQAVGCTPSGGCNAPGKVESHRSKRTCWQPRPARWNPDRLASATHAHARGWRRATKEGKARVSTPYNNRRGRIAQEQQMSRRTAHHRHSMEHLAAAYIPAGPQDRTACSSSLIVLTPPSPAGAAATPRLGPGYICICSGPSSSEVLS